MTRAQWHVTLRFLGDADTAVLIAALATIPWVDLAPVDVHLGPTTQTLGKVLMVPADGCDDLASHLRAATMGIGEPPLDQRFVGHLTLGRFKDQPLPSLVGLPVAALFKADEVLLLSSETRPEGAAHEVRARFSLGAETAV
jgi:2'-5' RNA ligase